MPLSATQKSALAIAAVAAVATERKVGVPAELTVAQWALESGWGKNAPGNNCFGIKATKGRKSQTFATTEYIDSRECKLDLDFEAFDSVEACFLRHAELLSTGKSYAAAWAQYLKDRDTVPFIQRIGIKYATAPNYAATLFRVLALPEVRPAIKAARDAAELVQIS